MSDDQIKLRLAIDVSYDKNDEAQKEIELALSDAAGHLAANGLLSGATAALVISWESRVSVLPSDDDMVKAGAGVLGLPASAMIVDALYLVVRGSDDGTFEVGDSVVLKADGSIDCLQGQGWISSADAKEASAGMRVVLDVQRIARRLAKLDKQREQLLRPLLGADEPKKTKNTKEPDNG